MSKRETVSIPRELYDAMVAEHLKASPLLTTFYCGPETDTGTRLRQDQEAYREAWQVTSKLLRTAMDPIDVLRRLVGYHGSFTPDDHPMAVIIADARRAIEAHRIEASESAQACQHDKAYSDRILATFPAQCPWICRKCGAEGTDTESTPEDFITLKDFGEYDRLKRAKRDGGER